MSEKTTNVSATLAIPENDRDWLVRLARATGHVRTHPQTREVDGNLSWAVNEAIGFLRSHFEQYQQEQAERMAQELEGGN